MKKGNFILYLLFLAATFSIQAQEQILQGKILNKIDVEGIHVLNTTSHYNTVTDENGNFSIRAKVYDTLVFSSISYMPDKFLVTKEIFDSRIFTIKLSELINELAEVFIRPNLSGNILTDLEKIRTKKPIDFEEAGLPGFKGKPEEKIVPLGSALFPTQIQLEPLYKYISGYYKKLKT